MFDVNARHSYVDGESNGCEQSIDDELGIPSVATPRVRKTRDVLRALEVSLFWAGLPELGILWIG